MNAVARERMSLADYRKLSRPRGKYGAKAVIVDGHRFDSKLEGLRYLYWSNLWRARAIAWFTRQAPFYLPGGIVYRADFLVAHLEGGFTVEDCKGVMTRVSINKIKQVEQIYGFKVEIITKKGWGI
jgi:hypothetical protein